MRKRILVVPSNATAWTCGSPTDVVRELCEFVLMKQRLSMDYYRAQWREHNCEVLVQGGWRFSWPCYYEMWRHYWETRLDVASWCWGQPEIPYCAVTSVAVVLAMLKQGEMWDEASSLFDYGEQIGINAITTWPSVYQTAWFVPMRPDANPSMYVPNGIGHMKEPTSPWSYGHVSKDDGFFDIWTSSALRPIAEQILPNFETIRSEWLTSEHRRTFGGPEVSFESREWSRYVPGTLGAQNWWEMGKAGQTNGTRLWGGFPGNIDTWWNIGACAKISDTLCRLLNKALPSTARPVPQYVLDTSSRWEHVDIKRILPGSNQAMHPDPCRCLWQICLDGCEGAFLQVGRKVVEYKAGEMVAFDATFEHSVWVREENTIARTVIHGVLHYCNGTYLTE